jgi:hypothetical protein
MPVGSKITYVLNSAKRRHRQFGEEDGKASWALDKLRRCVYQMVSSEP